ncbi:NAD(P)-dependent oxidoreductase [Streptomyces sp. NPDC017979]|uniref:NAD(P)-dependent oxidoreductase n=1 Tax=Streptomyces sp. NPDC017979 TaxID=3365024 RepID=UPI0037BC25F6
MSEGRVSVIGLGDMGRALASALLDRGWEVTVWNRTQARADALVERGAVRAASAEEAVRAGSLVLVCLLDYDAVRNVLEPAAGALRARTLVNLTNGSPEQAVDCARWAGEHGAGYLDGGIMAIPATIATAEAFVLYSGEEGVFTEHRAALEVLGVPHYLGADVGLAALYDLALLTATDMMYDGFHHAVALAVSRRGGSAAGVTEHLVPWLNSMCRIMPAFAAEIDAHRGSGTAPQITQGLDIHRAALDNKLAAAKEAGVSTELLDRASAELDELTAAGLERWNSPLVVRRVRSEPLT